VQGANRGPTEPSVTLFKDSCVVAAAYGIAGLPAHLPGLPSSSFVRTALRVYLHGGVGREIARRAADIGVAAADRQVGGPVRPACDRWTDPQAEQPSNAGYSRRSVTAASVGTTTCVA
jgi:hypothetical protein